MTLNEDSFSAKLYKWFYGKTYLPTEFCIYGRKLILAYILIIPSSILGIAYVIGERFEKNKVLGDTNMGERVGVSFVIYFLLFLLSTMVCLPLLFFGDYPEGTFVRASGPIGGFLWVLVLGFSIGYVIKTTYQYIYSNIPKTNNVLVEMYKAKKNKICPKITWIKK